MGQDGSTNFPSVSVSWGLERGCLGSSYNCVMTDETLTLSSRMRRWWAVILIIFDLQKEQVIKPQGHLANSHIIHQELSKASCYGQESQLSALLLAVVWLNSWNQNKHSLDCPKSPDVYRPVLHPWALRTSSTSESEFVNIWQLKKMELCCWWFPWPVVMAGTANIGTNPSHPDSSPSQ